MYVRVYLLLRHRSRHTVEMDTGKDWSEEMKDYEKPYFKEYMKLCSEIEMLPASEQETKVITMFHEFYKNMADSVELSSGIAVRMIAKTASMQTSRDAWKKLAEELASVWVDDCNPDGNMYCEYCDIIATIDKETGLRCDHSPDCPIEQLRDLQRSEG